MASKSPARVTLRVPALSVRNLTEERLTFTFKDHPRGRERRVPAEIDLDRRREPAQGVVRALGHEERGFGEIILRRDRLHGRIGQTSLRVTNGRGLPPNRRSVKASTW